MVTLDQVLVLQEKVESAVEMISSLKNRISQLESDNDALSSKCLELTKALDDKTELISKFEEAQNQIEQSILSTIHRLDSVEDAILSEQGDDAVVPEQAAEENTGSPSQDVPQEEFSQPQAENSQSIPQDEPVQAKAAEPASMDSPAQSVQYQQQELAESSESPAAPEQDSFGFDSQNNSPSQTTVDNQFDIF